MKKLIETKILEHNAYLKTKEYSDYFSEAKKQREDFLKVFPRERIKDLSLDEYVIGRRDHSAFCYALEHSLNKLGSIKGATSLKYGVFFGKKGEYELKKKFKSPEEALEERKQAIVDLLAAADRNDEQALKENSICDSVKGKLLHVYFPEEYLPVYSSDHLRYYCDILNVTCKSNSFLDLQQALIEWKNRNKETKTWSLGQLERFLYRSFPPQSKENHEKTELMEERLAAAEAGKCLLSGKICTDTPGPQKKKALKRSLTGIWYYPRDPNHAAMVLNSASGCAVDETHETFLRSSNGEPYLEAHHLIPVAHYEEFEYNVDHIANIVPLCSKCHDEIHYGKNREELIKKLYEKKKNELENAGLKISLKKLLSFYK